jgi:serine/threonine protein kinase
MSELGVTPVLTKLGSFQILEVIGRGGMGTVYRAIDLMIGRPAAVKVIRLLGYHDNDEQEWLRERLFREARAAGSLCHPGIVTIYQVGEEGDVAYIAMEFVDGATLETLVAAGDGLDRALLCRILCETAAALDYAHQRGLVHRDIKPANIMLTASGTTKVTDFGIAKTMLGQTVTKTGMILGTPYYMSPEQIRGSTLDGRSDQFALAVVAYEILAGRKPFQAEQLTSICYQIIHEEPLSPEEVNPGLSIDVAAVLRKGLAKDAGARYSACIEFAEALRAAILTPPENQEHAQPKESFLVDSLEAEPPSALPVIPGRTMNKRFRCLFLTALVGVLILASALRLAYVKARRGDAGVLHIPPRSRLIADNPPRLMPSPLHLAGADANRAPENIQQRGFREKPLALKPESVEPEQLETTLPPTAESLESPKEGILIWAGQRPVAGLLTITGAGSSSGSLSGALPRSAIDIDVYPAEASRAGLTVFTSDPRYIDPSRVPTLRGTATFVFDPRHATDLVVFEQPGPANNWERLVISFRNPKISACAIEWHHH